MTLAYFMEEAERFVALLSDRKFWSLSDYRRHRALSGLWYVGSHVTGPQVGQILLSLTEEYHRREVLVLLHGTMRD